ncbi:major facilitator superfamily domain-containing protein [Fennellomyces sp. T-0311]|nr:major facilitator superfamily domain-containing protein [Fennellomyces sp. T-0311]
MLIRYHANIRLTKNKRKHDIPRPKLDHEPTENAIPNAHHSMQQDPQLENKIATVDTQACSGPPTTPYELIFGRKQKAAILAMASMALLASSLPINIYYPSLIAIEKEFNTTAALVNLSVSGYKVVEAFAPMFWGTISDQWGRRPTYIITIAISTAACAGIAVSPTIIALIIIRMGQAFGASSINIIGNGVISDISVPATRAGYQAYYLLGYRTCIIVGPVLGGVIAEHLSWRWSFWILLCLTSLVLTAIILLFPETLRNLAGGYYNPTPLQWIRHKWQKSQCAKSSSDPESNSVICNPPHSDESKSVMEAKTRFTRIPRFREPYSYLLLPDFLLTMIISGLYFGVQCCFLINIPYVFADYYHLNIQEIGLCYLAQTGGSIVGGITVGHYLNYVFRKASTEYDTAKGNEKKSSDLYKVPLDFPIYRVRLGCIWPQAIVAQAVTILYGWSFVANMHIAIPLIIQFCVSVNIAFVNSAARCLLVDLRPGKGASVAASVGLVRQAFAVTGTIIMYPLTQAIGPGWTYTVLGIVLIVSNVIIFVLMSYGITWRQKRAQKDTVNS